MTNEAPDKPISPERQLSGYGIVFAHVRHHDPKTAAGRVYSADRSATETA